MSSSLLKPSVTPLIAFWARARAMPWKARCWRSSFLRWQERWPPSRVSVMPGGTGVLSLPFGPCISSAVSPMATFTTEGTGMTLRPTRDIVPSSLPDVAEDLAPHALARGRAAGHDPARRGENVDAEAAVHAGDLVLAAVDPAARAALPLQVRDHPLHPRPVLEEDADHALLPVGFSKSLEVRDVALVLEDAGDLDLQIGGGHVDLGQPRPDPVPDPGGHVRDGIGHVHRELPLASAYQLAWMPPGMSPQTASLRKQMRHISNFLRYARGRPQERQRLYLRTPNFGLRLALAIRDSLATTLPSYWFRNGIPRYERRSLDSSSVRAVVTKVTFMPRSLSTFA